MEEKDGTDEKCINDAECVYSFVLRSKEKNDGDMVQNGTLLKNSSRTSSLTG